MNKSERNVTRIIVILLGIAIWSLLSSCQFEFKSDCEEKNEYWEQKRDEELRDLWNTCPGKCDFGAEEKAIYKKYQSKIQQCK